MIPSRHLSPSVHRPRHSGTHLSGQAAVRALMDAVDSVCREGGVDPVLCAPHVIQCLNACREWHWNAYARIAGLPTTPDRLTQEAVIAAYVERCRS